MPKKNYTDVIDLMNQFKLTVLENKPTYKDMLEEVRMMKFKIRPVQGDISMLNLHEKDFIEILWGLGKLDEFFHEKIHRVNLKQQETFHRLFDELYQKYQDELNSINLKTEKLTELPAGFEMEIYKEATSKAN